MYITQKSTDDYTYKPKTNKNSYGINSISFNDKLNGWKITNPSQNQKSSSLNTREKLYDISGSNGSVSVPKIDYSTPKLPDFTSNTTKRQGSVIKDNIKNVLSQKYGELDVRHLFDDVDDADIESNISTAEATIKTNIDKGNLNKDIYSKLPNLRDGLALSYAAANKGKSKAATRAREAAYTESVEPLVKKTQTSMLSRELPKTQSSTPKTTTQIPSTEKLMGNVGEEPKTKRLVWNPNKKLSAEKLIYNGKNLDFTDNIQKLSYVPDNTTSIRFKAMNENRPEQDKKEESFGYIQKNEYPKSFLSKEVFGNYNNINHQLNNVSDEQQKFLEIAKKENITEAHARIKTYAEKWKDVPEYKWTIGDIAKWKTTGGDDYIHKEKIGFIKNYKDVILDAAEKYNIPPVLLAGVAYVEYGGDPMWIDDVAYAVRSFDWSGPKLVDENLTITKNPDFTSFGNTSIQVRRALEMLGYDASTASRKAVIAL